MNRLNSPELPGASPGAQRDPARLVDTGTGRRIRTPLETIDALRELSNEIGVTRVARITGLDRAGVEVGIAVRPNSPGLVVRMGKGTTWEQAEASALMETVEFAFAETAVLPQFVCSRRRAEDLAEVCRLERLPRYAGSRFTPDTEIAWTPALDLGSGTTKWVPHDMVHTRFAANIPSAERIFEMSSNGLASGNATSEALVHALCELIERDATGLFFRLAFEDRAQRAISPASLGANDYLVALLEQLHTAGFDLLMWDTTTDIGVPAFLCAMMDRQDKGGAIGIGAGCNLDAHTAAVRALTEAAQTRLAYISGTRDDFGEELYAPGARARSLLALALGAGRGAAARTARGFHSPAVPRAATRTVDEEIEVLLTRLAGAGCEEVLAVDLSEDEQDFSVVRVLVPGLEGLNEFGQTAPGARARQVLGGPE